MSVSGRRVRIVFVVLAFVGLPACDSDAARDTRRVGAPTAPDPTTLDRPAPDPTAPRPPLDAFEARIIRVVDGDTVIATPAGGSRLRVRIIGMDSPETASSPRGEQCHGRAATAYAVSVLSGVRVRAAYEGSAHRDRYQRELWHVWLPDGTFFAGRAVELGHARALRVKPHVAHAAYIDAKQQQARAAARGLWGACSQ
ncbi:MAG: thermonuclease family protein [Mycobacteriales bacterium]